MTPEQECIQVLRAAVERSEEVDGLIAYIVEHGMITYVLNLASKLGYSVSGINSTHPTIRKKGSGCAGVRLISRGSYNLRTCLGLFVDPLCVRDDSEFWTYVDIRRQRIQWLYPGEMSCWP